MNSETVTQDYEPFTFEQISWGEKPGLRNTAHWEQNLNVIKLLLERGGIPTRIIDNDYAKAVPKDYDFDGVTVEFLPHWGFYKVGELYLGIPADADVLNTDVEAAKYLASRSPETS